MKPQLQSHLQPWSLFNKSRSQVSPLLFAVFLLVIFSEVIESQFPVKTLPGMLGDLPFTLETGYIGVGESEDVQLFYYFIESERNPKDDPLMLWLSGGPGCSGLSGLMFEIGPFTFNQANSTLEKPILEINPYSWTKAASIIFLDQPAGSGFSYAKTPEAYIMNDDISAMQTCNFLKKWLVDHPKFLNNPLYVAGDSYIGIMLPMIVQEIYNGNEVGEGPQMNIKGYVLGNPQTDKSTCYNSRIPFAQGMALISDALYKSTKENCRGEYLNVDPNNILCARDLQAVQKSLERIYKFHVSEPYCDNMFTLETEQGYCEDMFTLKTDSFRRDVRSLEETCVDIRSLSQSQKQGCRDDDYLYSSIWANSKAVREALHIHEEFNDIEWVRCNASLIYDYGKEETTYTHNVQSTVEYHRRFADKNCQALIYSGDHDMNVPYLNTLDWIQSLNLPVEINWRPWYFNRQVAGYNMKYSKNDYQLTFATVKGGGHTAPEYKPKECLSMFMRWLANDPL